MVFFYFSGTGNSKYIAELFCGKMGAECICRSIEEKMDFAGLMATHETVGFCYPIYGSRVPRIMREFVKRHYINLKGKKIVIFCTQMTFSGDGARVFTDLFEKDYVDVIYAEHFIMPNNVCNFFLLPMTSDAKINKCLQKANKKMDLVCRNIKAGIVKKRGFNIISRILGLTQGVFMPSIEKKALNSININIDCNNCGLCVSNCPMSNLVLSNGHVIHKQNCTMCYRCVNLCPRKAITVFFHEKVRRQYKGI